MNKNVRIAVILPGLIVSFFFYQVQTRSAKKNDLENGKDLFTAYCQVCHGATGEGNGLAAANLPVKPRNFKKDKFLYGGDLQSIVNTIEKGYGSGTSLMVGWKGVLDPNQMRYVAQYILSFKGK